MKLSSIAKWILIIALLLAVGAGLSLCWVWVNSDRLVHDAVVKGLQEKAPGLDIRVGRVRFDGVDRVHVYDVAIRDKTSDDYLVRAPEIVAKVDRAEFIRSQQLIVRQVVVREPTIRVARNEDGSWNWQNLPPTKSEKKNLPEWSIRNATLDVSLDYGSDFPVASFKLDGGNATLTPADSRTFDFRGGISVREAGAMQLAGRWNLDGAGWKVVGRMKDVVANDRLMEVAANFSPEVRTRLHGLQRAVQSTAQRLKGEQTRVASADLNPIASVTMLPSFGVSGVMDVKFAVSQKPGMELDYQLLLGLANGTVNNEVLPFTLHDVNAVLYRDRERTSVLVHNARNDRTQVALEASLVTNAAGQPAGFIRTNIQDMPFDQRLKNVLPRSLRKVLDPMNVTGKVWATGNWVADGTGRWNPEDVKIELRNGTSLYDKFRYPVNQLNGTIKQRANTRVLDVNFRGLASDQQVTMVGTVANPGPESEVRLTMSADSLPLDDTMRLALDERGRNTMTALGVQGGMASGKVFIYRPPQVGAKTVFKVDANIADGRMTYTKFRYPLERITGRIVYASQTRSWVFSGLEGFHQNTKIRSNGSLDGSQQPGRLHINMAIEDGTFSRELRSAMSPTLQDLWDQVSPSESGRFNGELEIDWLALPGQRAVISVPDMVISGTSIVPRSFPYRLDDVRAKLSYVPQLADKPGTGEVTIHRMFGKHRGTTVDAGGWAQHTTTGDWTLHFDRLIAKDVIANDELKFALPLGLREGIRVLNPTAPFSIENTELEFRGNTDPEVETTAAWRTETVLRGGAISAGMDLSNVRGRVTNEGTYGPEGLRNRGRVLLDSVEVLGHTLTNIRGPYNIVDHELVIGARRVFQQRPQSVPVAERITANAFAGQLTCDAVVSLSEPQAYRVFVTANNSDLATYARQQMPRERNLSGKMNGWVYLHGLGDDVNNVRGEGQLQISPAAIYEVPVVLNLVNALGTLNFGVPDRVAFRYALLNFDIQNSNFDFKQIDLAGNSLSLRGRGRIGFDSRINMDFFAKPPRSAGTIPWLSQLVSSATTSWVNVRVEGTLDRPKTRVTPKFSPDRALGQFLQAFDPTGMPQLRVPLVPR